MSLKSCSISLRILVIVASTRPGRLAPAIAEWFTDATRSDADRADARFELADLDEIALPLLDEPEHPSGGVYRHEHTRKWSRQVAAADAFVIVTPEYNYGMPAVLKNALDFLYEEWAWKPVAFISYGNTSAGTRSVEMAKQVVCALRMMPIGATMSMRIKDSINNGRVRAGVELDNAARRVLAELTRVARAMRPLRVIDNDSETSRPVTALSIAAASEDDLGELLVLQRCCWVQEALANDTLDLAPFRETLADVRAWSDSWQVWCARRNGRVIGAVRARTNGPAWEIGRLMVAPDQAGQGLGSWLLAYAERHAPADATEFALFTGQRSQNNIRLYQRAGYTLQPTPVNDSSDISVHLTKPMHQDVERKSRDATVIAD
ncbi:bifunctional NAD(P)H-dependent oxidoreductase/GNAT family N-acetyltransferase [Paenarthrobacter sp. PH39-S1]|uniref:bifunctional NAD(P)H-dependent oxidoreductase/GNAT family N-acetyltransferase n=1 Tax=Paenarthrobacter sp. PH39-S1 TaxID=3046204 RepID=UPI0024B87A88|nr:bifunctional NAD(P)H-dependent oxidoreductase/GNAT family N-acetyltransferase [Paenarthrobacter sp. PH39-S1]MDJ0356297.1 bifunctional NAD(P)H-dependent oxidoreductase/GNAT family N-acetyltransferase [Paenarthrobacter sp. PH39-S1]